MKGIKMGILHRRKNLSCLLVTCTFLEVVKNNGSFCQTITIEGKLNKTVTIPCPSENAKVWYGPPKLVTYANSLGINKKLQHYSRLALTGNGQLLVKNLSRADEGHYRCVVIEQGFVQETNFQLSVLRKPTIVLSSKRIQAELGKVTNISVKIDSNPDPTVSWLKYAGGKLGSWHVSRNETRTFELTSTIFPMEERHLGNYSVVIRNEEGSVEVEFYLHGYEPSVIPESISKSCNTSNVVTLACAIVDEFNRTWNKTWQHSRNGYLIRTLSGPLGTNQAFLKIKYCDYRDEGTYTCLWTNNNTVFSSTVMLQVIGLPVVTDKKVIIINNRYVLFVYFYSSTPPSQVEWYMNDIRLGKENDFQIRIAKVTLNCYGSSIIETGYEAEYVIEMVSGANAINCRIRNTYGNTETLISLDMISSRSANMTILNSVNDSLQVGDKNVHKWKNHDRYMFPSVVAGAFFVLLSFTSLTLLVFVKRRRKRDERQLENERDNQEEQVPIESNYDEIESGFTENTSEQKNDEVNLIPVYLDVVPDESNTSTEAKTHEYMTLEAHCDKTEPNYYKSLFRITLSMKEKGENRYHQPTLNTREARKSI